MGPMGPMGPMLPPDLGPGAVAPWPRGPVAPWPRGPVLGGAPRPRGLLAETQAFRLRLGGQHPAICEVVLTFETREVNKVNKVKKFR